MRLLEYQAKRLLATFGLRFTEGRLVDSPAAAAEAVTILGKPAVLKAQVPFGGRGQAGAVKFADDPEQARRAAEELFNLQFRGHKVTSVSVETKVTFVREFYAGITWDTAARLPVAIFSVAGGVTVEDSRGGDLQQRNFDPWIGFRNYQGRELAARAGVSGKTLVSIGGVFEKLAQAFLDCDALLAEINPLVESADGELIGVDARMEIEDDAAYRQRGRLAPLGEFVSTGTRGQQTALEFEAQRIDAMDHRGVAGRVVEFDGDLALLIGGGGASLTVFDAIRRYGGRPANYCEVGGNPTPEKVAALTALLLSKPGVRKLAVIMNVVNNTRADVMAQGVLMGLERAGRKPAEALVVFRVPGSWEDEAQKLLSSFGVVALGREVSLDASARLAVERMNQRAD